MTVLVTGAAGHLGLATCEQLTKAGIAFRATDQRTRKDLPYRVQVANLLDREGCYRLIDDCEVVVHLANRPNENAGNPQEIVGENVTMNVNVFQAAVELGVKKIIYASSIQTMIGSRRFKTAEGTRSCHPYLPADGNTPPCPGNHYGASKVAGEVLLKYYAEHRALPSGISLRFPGMVKQEWFEWLRKNMALEKTWAEGYVDELFTFLSFADAGRLVVACIAAELPGYRCYFPVFPAPRVSASEKELVTRYFSNCTLRKPIDQLKGLVDLSQITADTGWEPMDDFRADPAAPALPVAVAATAR